MKNPKPLKFISILLSCLLIYQQTGFAQVASVELNLAGHFASLQNTLTPDRFRPLHLRSISYDSLKNNFKLLLDKGDSKLNTTINQQDPKNPRTGELENSTKELFSYFLVGLALPNDSFWVNLRPDSPDNIIDPLLAQTEVGRILLEADLQLKKDTSGATSPNTAEGKEYWDKLYSKAEELYGTQNVTIPTLTRPWIVPDEIIIRESIDQAYVYKATLKVMLEQDYLKSNTTYSFKDDREKQLNEYSSQLIRELIIPKLTREINSSKRYAPLRQVYYSLILAQWFKARANSVQFTANSLQSNPYTKLINSKNLTNLQSKAPYSSTTYFTAYKENFSKGEYNIKEPKSTPYGQVVRSYFSGGAVLMPADTAFAHELSKPLGAAGNQALLPSAIQTVIDNPTLTTATLKIGPADKPGEYLVYQTESTGASTMTAANEEELSTKAQAVEKAHQIAPNHAVGTKNLDGTFNPNTDPSKAFSFGEIKDKMRAMKQGGVTQQERKDFIRRGVAGRRQQPQAGTMPFSQSPQQRDSGDLLMYSGIVQLFDRLNDSEARVRQAVAQAFTELAKTSPDIITKEIVARLFEKLNDSEAYVRQAAAQALAELAKTRPEIVARLFEKLNDSELNVRQAAAQAFTGLAKTSPDIITKEIVARLFEKLNDSELNVRQAAAQAFTELAKTKPELITKEIVNRLFDKLNDSDWYMRQLSAHALAELAKTKPEIVARLFEKLKDSNARVREAAAQAFTELANTKPNLITKEIAKRLSDKLNDSEAYVREAAAQAFTELAKTSLELITKEIVARLFEKLNDSEARVRQLSARALAELAKTKPELITSEIVNRLFDKLNDSEVNMRQLAAHALAELAKTKPEIVDRLFEKLNDSEAYVREVAAQALAELAKTKPELITKEIVKRLFDRLNDSEARVRQAAAQAFTELAKTSPELITKEIVARLFDKLNDSEARVRQVAARALAELAKTKPEIVNRLFEKLNDSDNTRVREAAAEALAELAKTKPELITSEIVNRLFEKLSDIEWYLRQLAAEALAELAKTKPEIVDRLFEKLNAEVFIGLAKIKPEIVIRFFERLNDSDNTRVREAAAEALAELAKTKPELITSEIVNRLFDKLNDSEVNMRQLAAHALAELAKTKPEIVNRLFEKLNDRDAYARQAVAEVLAEVIARSDMDLARINYYREELLNPAGEFGLKEEQLLEGYLITSFLLERGEDFGLWLNSSDSSVEDFNRLTALLAGNVISGAAEEAVVILKQRRNINETIAAIEDLLLKRVGLDLSRPTESWVNLQEWLDFSNRYSTGPTERVTAHIIVTMKLLQADVGTQSSFRANGDIEVMFPAFRQSLIQLLNKPLHLLTKRNLTKALVFGNSDQIFRLRRQADSLTETMNGGDIDEGLVGTIKVEIHNRPNYKNLRAARAYRVFVDTGDASQLNELGYQVVDSDRVPVNRRQKLLGICDALITTLEDIYGEGSANSTQEHFQHWQSALPGHKDLKARVSALINSFESSFDYLEEIVQTRHALQGLLNDLSGEPLLLTILLDNRLEVLFYGRFNTMREHIDFNSLQEATRVIFSLLANTRLNGYSTEELDTICQDLIDLVSDSTLDQDECWLKLYSVYKRAERIIDANSRQAIDEFQKTAERLATGLGAQDNPFIEKFSSNIFRSDTVYLLSTALTDAKAAAMHNAGISGWQVVVPGKAEEGRVRFIHDPSELASVRPDEIIVIERIPSDAPPINQVAAIITLREDSLLSHSAIRARQNNIPFAVCSDVSLLEGLDGQLVSISVEGDNVVISAPTHAPARAGGSQVHTRRQITITPMDSTSRDFIIMPEAYQGQTVGNKALRFGQIPANLIPGQVSLRHFTLSPALFSQVLASRVNDQARAQLSALEQKALQNPSAVDITQTLEQIRTLIENLQIPAEALSSIMQAVGHVFGTDNRVRLFLRSSTNAEDLPGYPGAGLYDSSGNIAPESAEVTQARDVWASVWSDRAFFDRQANEVNHLDVSMAVMILEQTVPDYAFVIHTENPADTGSNEVIIELVQGFGESLVSGRHEFSGSPYRFIYNRVTGELRLVRFADKNRKLIVDQGQMRSAFTAYQDDYNTLLSERGRRVIQNIARAAVAIEGTFGAPQDIEGALVAQNGQWQVAFLQSRDQLVSGAEVSDEDLQGAPSISSTGFGNELGANRNILEGILGIAVQQRKITQAERQSRLQAFHADSRSDLIEDLDLSVDNQNVYIVNGQKVVVIDAPYLSVTEEGEQCASAGLRRGVVYITRVKFQEWQQQGILEQQIKHEQNEVNYLRGKALEMFPGLDEGAAYELFSNFLKNRANREQAKALIKEAHQYAESQGHANVNAKQQADPTTAATQQDNKKGGIDFRTLPIVIQSMDNLKAGLRSIPQNTLKNINLTQEWSDIERMVNSGTAPSAERLKEYLAASCFKGYLDNDTEKILSCIAGILRMEEETCCLTDPTLKDILVVLGSGSNAGELKLALAR